MSVCVTEWFNMHLHAGMHVCMCMFFNMWADMCVYGFFGVLRVGKLEKRHNTIACVSSSGCRYEARVSFCPRTTQE